MLSEQHTIAPDASRGLFARRMRGPLLSRLAATEATLTSARQAIAQAAADGAEIGPAGAWLLDNFFVVLEQVPEIRATLPTGYYQELPKLASGVFAGYPRIYAIVVELIAHTDGKLDEASVALMIGEYQKRSALTLGELWAVPAMLRMGYLENVRRMARRVRRDIESRKSADAWVTRLVEATGTAAVANELSLFVHQGPELTPAFLTRFLQQIRSRRADFTPLLWLEQWVAEDVMSVEEAAQRSFQELALTQLVMSNSITSLRSVITIDWVEFVEGASVTEQVLRNDPDGTYATLTRPTRDHYRHAVERIAKVTRKAERAIAQMAIDMAAASGNERDPRERHVGYYLIGDGLPALEQAAGYAAPFRRRVYTALRRHPSRAYFSALTIAAAVVLIGALSPLRQLPHVGLVVWLAAVLLALVPTLEVAVAIVHQLVNYLIPPDRLPRLDFELGVPTGERTLVVVPLLLGSVEGTLHAVEQLEVQYLANRDPEVRFALLSDLRDAAEEVTAGDEAIIAAAVQGIRALNTLHGEESGTAPFYLLHRHRAWNAADSVWMGWERKRGKLAALNAFLAGDTNAIPLVEGERPWLPSVRHVITLDSDTMLPRGAAASLIGTAAHPLNRPVYDAASGRVVRGYGILQPRVSVSLASASESRFASIYAGHPGLDPYTTAVSDVYQDLFAEGSFTGKGIYDVRVFEEATRGRFPENALLSHDLIEGAFVRAALVTDIEVYDDYPTRYSTATRRADRWIRGDWQLLPWLAANVPSEAGTSRNPLSVLSRWKIVDNLRRSLTPIALCAWLIAGLTVLPGSAARWAGVILLTWSAPWAIPLLISLFRPPRAQSWRPYYAALAQDAGRAASQFVLACIFLPDQALLAARAIARTLWRLYVTHRRLLEWQTALHAELVTGVGRRSVWRRMLPAVLLGVVALAAIALRNRNAAVHSTAASAALAFVALAWLLAPEVALALSAPLTRRDLVLTASERTAALRYAVRHWRFFERFATKETHWLIPDNFQETPEPVIATRTSPTNIGLQLLATVSAGDLGLLTCGEMLDRLERSFNSLDQMPKLHGHFYNWYDLADLRVLDPPYVSTVDSGNLAGHLIALAEGCLAFADGAIDRREVWPALDAEGASFAPAVEASHTSWVGDRLLAYQSASLDLRHRAAALAKSPDAAAAMLWGRQRLDASGAALSQLDLDAEHDASTSLRAAAETSPAARQLVGRLESIARRAKDMAMAMDFRLVYNTQRKLLSIGYDARSGTLDDSNYDLLASESRLASFIAVAKGDAPVEHWFRLGRSLTVADGATALVSWSGSMFEYLMPLLVMPPRPFSLLDQTCHAAVLRQIRYARSRGVPWGISESAYNLRDRHATYQYRAFGVPDLALKRGLANELVIAPYASLLASMVDAHEALANGLALEALGGLGEYGFYDAIDFTRREEAVEGAVVRTFMAHHVGMSLVALTNALSVHERDNESLWQRRFMADPGVRASALLLDERVPRRYATRPSQSDLPIDMPLPSSRTRTRAHVVDTADTPHPHVGVLGGRRYSVLLTNGGGGHSRSDGVDVYRWRPDATQDDTGHWIYIRDVTAGAVWSAAHQPVCAKASSYRASFAADRVVFTRRDGAIETRTEIVVLASEQAEVRNVTLLNHSATVREIELTSYGEVVLSPAAADIAHQAFQKLFVETSSSRDDVLLATRRPRSADEHWPWCAHIVAAGPERVGALSHETDRAQFIGRGRTARAPEAMDQPGALSQTVGAVLDPILSLRVRVRIEPGRSAAVAFTTAVGATRDAVLQLADRYRELGAAQRALSLASTEAEVELRDLDIAPADVGLYQELAGALLFPRESLRAPAEERTDNTPGQAVLWSQGISGDWPIVLATVRSAAGLASVQQLLAAHRYWRTKGIVSDLVILNARPHSYVQELHDQIVTMSISSSEGSVLERPGGVFIRRTDVLSKTDAAVLRGMARIHVLCDGVGLGEIVAAKFESDAARRAVEESAPTVSVLSRASRVPGTGPKSAVFPNGYGAQNARGAFEMVVDGAHVPPAPWANVIANPNIGFCITERGSSCTWAGNSFFYRLTPWFNDPVSDPCGDALYLRDLDSGATWSPTPAPAPAITGANDDAAYSIEHDAGISRFTHSRGDIDTALSIAVPVSDTVRISTLRITNSGTRARRLSLTSYVEWTLGATRQEARHQVDTRRDDSTGAVLAVNRFAPDFTDRVAFSWMSEPVTSATGRRDHFIGRNNDLAAPAAMQTERLSEVFGVGLDPCAALRGSFELKPGETREIVVLLGAGSSEDDVRALIARHGTPALADAAVTAATDAWNARLSVITAHTPDAAFDALFNRWALYQTLSCRMWARSALYQSSGAFGFRDQLQDCMALVYAEPALARAHIMRAASRQFPEGDVQHWWHEPSGRGVRTRFSDDLAWLPYVADHYVTVTGDANIWNEPAPYLDMRVLAPHEEELYDQAHESSLRESLYAHCCRALDRACTTGAHGLPLMGAGDWNDGMNRVGVDGHGESVWLAWFLTSTLRRFAVHADVRNDVATATRCRSRADAYAAAVEATSWDGAWYRRAYYDDGSPIGSAANEECRIDSIAQSWSVLSGAGDPARARTAMESVQRELVRTKDKLLLLLTPPFDKSPQDPGYIKGYLPGVRENGAQYTHAALWSVLARAELGDGDAAGALFSMLNPQSHAGTKAEADTYKVEPYVIAADVYAVAGHVGRGGWTWYTGSASWCYRVALEGVLGFHRTGNHLGFDPCIPSHWPSLTLEYRHLSSVYAVTIENPDGVQRGVTSVSVDGAIVERGIITLADDGKHHAVVIRLGRPAA